jgi:hypothetical protein
MDRQLKHGFRIMLTKVEWVLAQPLASPLTCIGDGHDGIWNIIKQMAPADQRLEILDWYHLKENLYKVGGSLKRLRQAEAFLWRGQVDATLELFLNSALKQAQNFCEYLTKHRHRIINYEYFQVGAPLARLAQPGEKRTDRFVQLARVL